MNQRTSKAGSSSSCQCSTTLYGTKKIQKYVKKIQEKLGNTLKDFLAVIGLFLDLVQKRSGTALVVADPMDLGIELQRRCWETSKELVTHSFDAPASLTGDN